MTARKKSPAKKRAAKRGWSKPKKAAKRKAAKRGAPPKKDKNGRTLPPGFVAAAWRPGQSGNPAGRSKKLTFEEEMMKYLDVVLEGDERGRTRLQAMVEVVFSVGVTGKNTKIMRALLDRLWPKPLILKGDPDAPLIPDRPLKDRTPKELRQLVAMEKRRRDAGGGE